MLDVVGSDQSADAAFDRSECAQVFALVDLEHDDAAVVSLGDEHEVDDADESRVDERDEARPAISPEKFLLGKPTMMYSSDAVMDPPCDGLGVGRARSTTATRP